MQVLGYWTHPNSLLLGISPQIPALMGFGSVDVLKPCTQNSGTVFLEPLMSQASLCWAETEITPPFCVIACHMGIKAVLSCILKSYRHCSQHSSFSFFSPSPFPLGHSRIHRKLENKSRWEALLRTLLQMMAETLLRSLADRPDPLFPGDKFISDWCF